MARESITSYSLKGHFGRDYCIMDTRLQDQATTAGESGSVEKALHDQPGLYPVCPRTFWYVNRQSMINYKRRNEIGVGVATQ